MKKVYTIMLLIIVFVTFSACNQRSLDDPLSSAHANLEGTSITVSENKTEPDKMSVTPTEIQKKALPKPDQEIEKHIDELTKNGSRKWGTESELIAAKYIKGRLEAYGYTSYIQEFPAYEFDIKAMGNGDYFNINPYDSEIIGTGHNVIGDVTINEDTDQILVLCAHYDTVSKELGIIDNTSGVVTLLEVARQASGLKLPFNLRFIFFSSEERYLLGSKYYVSNLNDHELEQIVACINVDMVGYKDGQELIIATPYFVENMVGGSSSLDGIDNALTSEWHRIFPEYKTYVKGDSASDHVSFEKKEIPNILITQKHFDTETVRKKDSDFENLSIFELENTINAIIKYIKNLDVSQINYTQGNHTF